MIKCTYCDKELSGAADTFGSVHAPLCQKHWLLMADEMRSGFPQKEEGKHKVERKEEINKMIRQLEDELIEIGELSDYEKDLLNAYSDSLPSPMLINFVKGGKKLEAGA